MRRFRKRVRHRLLEYDSISHRLWIAGQRCHHGAAGSIVVTTACGSLLSARLRAAARRGPLAVVALAGSVLMAHDWKDRAVWFERGRGSELA